VRHGGRNGPERERWGGKRRVTGAVLGNPRLTVRVGPTWHPRGGSEGNREAQMRDTGKRHRGQGLARSLAIATLLAGAAVTNGPNAHSVGGLCNGQEASHAWLNASGQRGPALIDGTAKDDVIIGSDGDDTIDGKGGDDVICGELGNDSISGGPGNDTLRGDAGDDDLDGGPGRDTLSGDGGNDTVAGGSGKDVLVGGDGDDVIVGSDDDEIDKLDGGNGFDDCVVSTGDEVHNCEY
jgi:Ca2+-binding RTX toxin-like protein